MNKKWIYLLFLTIFLLGCQKAETGQQTKKIRLHQTKTMEISMEKEQIPEFLYVEKSEKKIVKTQQKISDETTPTKNEGNNDEISKKAKLTVTTNKNVMNNDKPQKKNKQEKQKIKDPNRPYLLPSHLSEPRKKPITHVVIHFMSNAPNNPNQPYIMDDIIKIFTDYGVSSHYVIDREGNIHPLVEENRVAYHAGRGKLPGFPETDQQLNHYSIGIELLAIGTKDEMKSMMSSATYNQIDPKHIGFTEKQYESLKNLLNQIHYRHPQILLNRDHIVGHDEYSPQKTDPGELFDWTKIGLMKDR